MQRHPPPQVPPPPCRWSYLIVALVLAEMLLQLAVSGEDLRTYSAFLLPVVESVSFAIAGICME